MENERTEGLEAQSLERSKTIYISERQLIFNFNAAEVSLWVDIHGHPSNLLVFKKITSGKIFL